MTDSSCSSGSRVSGRRLGSAARCRPEAHRFQCTAGGEGDEARNSTDAAADGISKPSPWCGENPPQNETETQRRHRKESRCITFLRRIGWRQRSAVLGAAPATAIAVKQEGINETPAGGNEPEDDMAALLHPVFGKMAASTSLSLYLIVLLAIPFACMALSDGSGAPTQ